MLEEVYLKVYIKRHLLGDTMRRIIIICVSILSLLTLCGCSNSSDSAANIEEDFVSFMNEKLPPVEQEERVVMEKYNSYFSDNQVLDPEELLQDLDQNILPQYETFMEHLSDIKVKTTAVQDILDLYIESMDLQLQSMQMVRQALAENSEEYQVDATELLAQATAKYEEYQQAVESLAEKYQISIK